MSRFAITTPYLIVVIALVITPDGFPLAYELDFPHFRQRDIESLRIDLTR